MWGQCEKIPCPIEYHHLKWHRNVYFQVDLPENEYGYITVLLLLFAKSMTNLCWPYTHQYAYWAFCNPLWSYVYILLFCTMIISRIKSFGSWNVSLEYGSSQVLSFRCAISTHAWLIWMHNTLKSCFVVSLAADHFNNATQIFYLWSNCSNMCLNCLLKVFIVVKMHYTWLCDLNNI